MSIFHNVPNRIGTRSVKWDLVKNLYGSDEILPMWVADMDFSAPEAVTTALSERAKHGVFGYTFTDLKIHKSITNWINDRHGWEVSPSSLYYSPGVVTTLHMAVQALTKAEDAILIQTPIYPPFYDIVESHGRKLVTNSLLLKNNRYEIDFDDFEEKLKQGVKAFILCNPHNPVGRVWTQNELKRMAELCLQYDVMIFSDEIHADLIYKGSKHIPIASLSERTDHATITCMSPTKTFNLAGLQVSYAVISDKEKRDAISAFSKTQGIMMLNTMGITALEAAYTDGENWLEGLMETLENNKTLVNKAFENRSEIDIIDAEGTYLLWMDCRNMGFPHEDLKKFMQEKAKVGLNDGITFGKEGEGFMRMNIACPSAVVEDGLDRIITALDQYRQ
ncbi:PatB family C-S lyase [Aquibacillus koreensis]|uniref:cysteine-S-conjugate beta-lyase n=1 Tax=Aquibacillus koreensis TaxID=279446 RepID=A0A9X3WN65_9BACI|nr:PatB family C-S lyase [Aquibacillus koreensis]MCT2535863.1 PatB family C-S lyase [Aquibacillus koreensis]MDC3420319.1 PatB family C-S lyase [Aquibacillus koreensis]